MSYNVALLDHTGYAAIVAVAPDRPAAVTPNLTAGNRQGWTEWPEHAARCATVAREETLAVAISDPSATGTSLIGQFLRAPLWRDPATTSWGTVYTAVYDCDFGTLDLLWPDDASHLSVYGTLSAAPVESGPSP